MKTVVSWSGGKDSALALHRAVAMGLRVEALLSMFEEDGARSRSHGIPAELMRAQAQALGLPLVTRGATWARYEEVFIEQLRSFAQAGFTRVVFGDIDLQPHREWEEKVCAAAGLEAVLPLWQQSRRALVDEVLQLGYRARVVCVNGRWLDAGFCGREFDAAFLADLPAGVDACGENGEFHTFVFAGPRFQAPVPHQVARVVRHDARHEFGNATYFIAELA